MCRIVEPPPFPGIPMSDTSTSGVRARENVLGPATRAPRGRPWHGKLTVNVVPRPTPALSTRIVPPWRSVR